MIQKNIINIILVTGFLGSGKTTLVNRIINRYSSRKIGLIINDFGKISVDGMLVSKLLRRADIAENQAVYEIKNGSLFCSCLSAELVVALKKFIEISPEILIIETSGLSDPSTFEQILLENRLGKEFNILSSVCIVDPISAIKLSAKIVAIEKQIRSSNIHIINKVDTIDETQLNSVRKLINKYNSNPIVIETSFTKINLDLLENIEHEELKTKNEISCNTVNSRPGSIVLPQQNITLDGFKKYYKSIACKIMRLKGFINIDNKLCFISSNNDNVEIESYSNQNKVELGLSVLLVEDNINYVVEKWEKINFIKIEG